MTNKYSISVIFKLREALKMKLLGGGKVKFQRVGRFGGYFHADYEVFDFSLQGNILQCIYEDKQGRVSYIYPMHTISRIRIRPL